MDRASNPDSPSIGRQNGIAGFRLAPFALGGEGVDDVADCCGQHLRAGKNAIDPAERCRFLGTDVAADAGVLRYRDPVSLFFAAVSRPMSDAALENIS